MLSFSRLRPALVVGLLSLAACQVYDASLVEGETDSGPPVACDLRVPPERPAMADGDDGEEYLFGLRMVRLDQEEDWRNIGYDLDGRCTIEPAFDSECRPPNRRQAPSDGNEGVDNTFGRDLFPLVNLAVMGLQDTVRAADAEGTMPGVRIRGWNGEDDDSRVDIAVASGIYAVPADPATGEIPTFDVVNFKPVVGDEALLPLYDGSGSDYFFLRDDTFFEGDIDIPLIRDDNAYVANRVLVAQLPDRFELVFPSDVTGVRVILTDGLITARISDDASQLEDVNVAGRWAVLDMLQTAEDVGLCRGSPQYNLLLGQLDTIADIRAQPGTGGEGVFCDAISTGVLFQGDRMTFGGLVPGPSINTVCDNPTDGGVPPADAGAGDAGTGDAGPGDAGPGMDAGM